MEEGSVLDRRWTVAFLETMEVREAKWAPSETRVEAPSEEGNSQWKEAPSERPELRTGIPEDWSASVRDSLKVGTLGSRCQAGIPPGSSLELGRRLELEGPEEQKDGGRPWLE